MRLDESHRSVLRAMADGSTLKIHRTVDGAKEAKLHPLAGPAQPVAPALLDFLKRHRLVHSNLKFPAATYLLTERGLALARQGHAASLHPVTDRTPDTD